MEQPFMWPTWVQSAFVSHIPRTLLDTALQTLKHLLGSSEYLWHHRSPCFVDIYCVSPLSPFNNTWENWVIEFFTLFLCITFWKWTDFTNSSEDEKSIAVGGSTSLENSLVVNETWAFLGPAIREKRLSGTLLTVFCLPVLEIWVLVKCPPTPQERKFFA